MTCQLQVAPKRLQRKARISTNTDLTYTQSSAVKIILPMLEDVTQLLAQASYQGEEVKSAQRLDCSLDWRLDYSFFWCPSLPEHPAWPPQFPVAGLSPSPVLISPLLTRPPRNDVLFGDVITQWCHINRDKPKLGGKMEFLPDMASRRSRRKTIPFILDSSPLCILPAYYPVAESSLRPDIYLRRHSSFPPGFVAM